MVPHFSGKTVVVGHTIRNDGDVLDLGFLVVIDTVPPMEAGSRLWKCTPGRSSKPISKAKSDDRDKVGHVTPADLHVRETAGDRGKWIIIWSAGTVALRPLSWFRTFFGATLTRRSQAHIVSMDELRSPDV